MKFLKTGLLTGVAAVALAGLWGGALNGGAVSAQENRSDGSASIACVPAAGNWTDCTLTLNVGVGVGGSVAASLDNSQATLAFCDDPSQLCGITGNAAVFSCPTGCGAGTQFVLSALGSPDASLAKYFAIASSGTMARASAPGQPVPVLGGSELAQP